MGRLTGRATIVTGASRGLGRAIALAMGAEGASVAVVARTEQVWDERLPGTIFDTVETIREAGGQAVAIRADLLQPDDRARLVAEARAALGPITILVNNAAFTAPGRPPAEGAPIRSAGASAGSAPSDAKSDWPTFLNTPPRAYQRHFEMVFAAYELMQLVAPDMQAAGYGAVINITSGASRMPGDGPYPDRTYGTLAGYGGSKAALEHLSQVAAYDLGDHNIAVNSLSPSRTFLTPGVAYYAKTFNDVAPESEFGEAAVRLALVDPAQVTGRTIGHAQVLDGSFLPYEMHALPA
jgi:NAD(P)-dependent dehydrogenase (short-subunit alcohol dehydrogenase family)